MSRVLSPVFAAAAMLAAAGCSTFEADWAAAADNAHDGLSGRWEGMWKSSVNGHEGRLRAIILPASEPGKYTARYRAGWGCCFHFEIDIPMSAEPKDDAWLFHGEHDLGAWGVFGYDGRASGGTFTADYDNKFDKGRFEMKRPPPPPVETDE